MTELEREHQIVKEQVDEYKRLEDEAKQKLADIGKDFDKMASKESIFLEKAVRFYSPIIYVCIYVYI